MRAHDWLKSRGQTAHVVVALVGLGHGIQSGEVEKKIVRGM